MVIDQNQGSVGYHNNVVTRPLHFEVDDLKCICLSSIADDTGKRVLISLNYPQLKVSLQVKWQENHLLDKKQTPRALVGLPSSKQMVPPIPPWYSLVAQPLVCLMPSHSIWIWKGPVKTTRWFCASQRTSLTEIPMRNPWLSCDCSTERAQSLTKATPEETL